MINKNDPLVGAVQKIMEENAIRYQVEQKLCEELGIYSKNALPNEHKANFAALLDQRINEALHPSKYSEKQKKLAAIGGNPSEIDAPDLAGARKGRASHIEEEQLDEKELSRTKAKKGTVVKMKRTDQSDEGSAFEVRQGKRVKATGDYDRGSNSFWMGQKGEKGQKSYDTPKDVVKSVAKNIKEEGGETREGGAVTKDGKTVVSPTAMRAEPEAKGPSASDRSALTNKIKSIMKEAKERMELDEVAVSRAQADTAGAALRTREGKYAEGKKRGPINTMAVSTMSDEELRKLASTERKGLPERITKKKR